VTARRRRLLLLSYLALLIASHLWRASNETLPPPDGKPVIELAAIAANGERLEKPVELSYALWEPELGVEPAGPPVLMLHGSPGSSYDFFDLGPRIATERRVIAPDLPGFGRSEHDVPDYSLRTHARYTLELLNRLEIPVVDVVGFSMGGGVGIELAALAPERVRSLTLLSSIGVQELELLGNYDINHAIHGLQLGALWLLYEAVPHFGAFDGGMLSIPYARNFYDSDQRPLRGMLERFEPPVLILHGDDDPLVPVAAAHEHHRILPQSRQVIFEGNHFMVFQRSDELAVPLRGFLAAVDAGEAPSRAQASPARVTAAAQPYDPQQRESAAGFALIVIMLLLAAGTLVSEDLTCIAAGLLIAQGAIDFFPAVAACVIGIVLGDIGLYWAGRLIGEKALHRAPFRWVLSEGLVADSAAWFDKRGPWVILISRFVPGTRLATYFTSGLLKTGFLRFTFFFILASILWTPLLVGVSSLVGARAFEYFEIFRRNALLGVLLLVLMVWLAMKVVPAMLTWRGRRLLLTRWRRLTRWEFWPWWVIYLPVIVTLAWQALRHRSATLFTLANPGMPAGGFVGEPKGELLEQMPAEAVPKWVSLDAELPNEARLDRVKAFLDRPGVDLPIVLKPDKGERGFGVCVAHSLDEIEEYLGRFPFRTLVQERIEGSEFGVFYVRRPGEESGRVTSIALKVLPRLRGDGISTVEHLILSDQRTVCSAHLFLAAQAGTLLEVPEEGAVIELGALGTHSRGATFLDGNHLRTPELEAAVEKVARTVEGFYFGRFDLRAPSEEHFQRGEGLKVLELNGVTSEEAHMYDPANGFGKAVRTLSAQWRTAFEIGAVMRKRGFKPLGLMALAREVWRYHRWKQG
jgi:pimeloyl-ACP methyl ester carboxylesterase/membrane protein DedA with SNARE-associated domain